MVKIVLQRKMEWVNMADPYVVYLNGKKLKPLLRGEKRCLKVKPGILVLKAEMDGGYSSEEVVIAADETEKIKVQFSGFRFQQYILPYFVIAIPLFIYARDHGLWEWWLGLPLFLPAGIYSLYRYFLRPDRYLKVSVAKP